MVELFAAPWAHYLTLTLVHFLWQGLLIGIICAAVLKITDGQSPRVRYAASLAGLCLMAVLPLITYAVLHSRGSELHAVPAANAQAVAAVGRKAQQLHNTSSDHRSAASAVPARAAQNINGLDWSTVVHRSQPYLLLLWMAGVMLCGGRLTIGLLNLMWLRFGRVRVAPELIVRAQRLASRLGMKAVRIFGSTRMQTAAAVGFFRPVVLLPASWLTALPTDVLEAVIAHELAHIRRYDVWANLLQRIVETLLFYHPIVWWLSHRVRLERELCCDEVAVQATGRRRQYVLALEQIGRLEVYGALSVSSAFTGDRKMNLLRRVHYLIGSLPSRPQRGASWLVGLMALLLPLMLLGLSASLSEQTAVAQEREREEGERPRSAEEQEGERERDVERRETERRESAERRDAERREEERAEGERREGERREGERREGERREGERREGERDRREGDAPRQPGPDGVLRDFRPQTDREAALFQIIVQLRREIAALHQELRVRGGRPGADRPREGDRPGADRPRESDRPGADRPREGDRPRDGDRPAAREGDRPRESDRPREGDRPRDGDRPEPRDREF